MTRQRLVDVHSHIHGEDFDADRSAVLEQAAAARVGRVLAMGEGFEDNLRVLEVAERHHSVLPCLGLHPDRAGSEPLEPVLDQIRQHADRLAAVGEVGLDYWVAKEHDERETQRRVLTALVSLAGELDLPLSVHSRSAGHHAVDLLEAAGARRVCMHAFDGSAKHAARAADLGFLLSVPPSVVRSQQKQKMVRRLPLSAMMLETDSPVLGPDRELRNVPANVTVAATAIAEIKGCSVEEVHRVTSENAYRLFRLERFN
jgi:TatD DNase family protein